MTPLRVGRAKLESADRDGAMAAKKNGAMTNLVKKFHAAQISNFR